MKKVLCVLVLLSVVIAGTAVAKDYMYAKRYGTYKFTGLDLDHTYRCANNGQTSCWAFYGGQTGGRYIPYTFGYGSYKKSKCPSTNWGCRFVYLVEGVCHQETNRGLYKAGKTVYKARGYWASKAAFGTYGRRWTMCKCACRLKSLWSCWL